jgi:hypothetical protein
MLGCMLSPRAGDVRCCSACILDDVVCGRIGIWSIARQRIDVLRIYVSLVRYRCIKLLWRHARGGRNWVIVVVTVTLIVVERVPIIPVGLVCRVLRWRRLTPRQRKLCIDNLRVPAITCSRVPHENAAMYRHVRSNAQCRRYWATRHGYI